MKPIQDSIHSGSLSLEEWLSQEDQAWMLNPKSSSPQQMELIEDCWLFYNCIIGATKYYLSNPADKFRKMWVDEADEKFNQALQELWNFNRKLFEEQQANVNVRLLPSKDMTKESS